MFDRVAVTVEATLNTLLLVAGGLCAATAIYAPAWLFDGWRPAQRLVEWIGRGWVRLACLAIGVGLAAVALVRMTGVAHLPGAW